MKSSLNPRRLPLALSAGALLKKLLTEFIILNRGRYFPLIIAAPQPIVVGEEGGPASVLIFTSALVSETIVSVHTACNTMCVCLWARLRGHRRNGRSISTIFCGD